jgi:hypothetical protein
MCLCVHAATLLELCSGGAEPRLLLHKLLSGECLCVHKLHVCSRHPPDVHGVRSQRTGRPGADKLLLHRHSTGLFKLALRRQNLWANLQDPGSRPSVQYRPVSTTPSVLKPGDRLPATRVLFFGRSKVALVMPPLALNHLIHRPL